ncbi:hypothetical protein MWU60_08070 [Yoonia sp. F2084L]|uniref:hypothetical protein n=1 Tax=Yoonia sp. F2084L TaxID=2926419 RepID=UPI001FF4CD83|nr:hypothetical protein [Yoonia sp. F2084L]MCK0095525.1 hypothetical protein [Yoonia sp. F2084L]
MSDVFLLGRQRALADARELLWDNLEESIWWDKYRDLTASELSAEKIRLQHENFHPVLVSFQTSFVPTILEVQNEAARLVLQYGASRRLASIYAAMNVIADVSYPARSEVCSEEEHGRLSDALMIFYVSIPAFFDALSMASHRVFQPKHYSEKDADLFSRKYWDAIGLIEGYSNISGFTGWFRRIKNVMRHPYAHRIPPYVPAAEHSIEDAEKNKRLQAAYSTALVEKRFDDLSRIMGDQRRLGTFSPKIYFFEEDSWTPLNPTVFEDLFTFQVAALSMLEALLPSEGFLNKGT